VTRCASGIRAAVPTWLWHPAEEETGERGRFVLVLPRALNGGWRPFNPQRACTKYVRFDWGFQPMQVCGVAS